MLDEWFPLDSAGDLVEGADDDELARLHLVHDPLVLGEGLHLALDVGHHGLAVARIRLTRLDCLCLLC